VTGGRYAAVDLGASSGRVVVGHVGPDRLDLTEVHRFPNRPVRLPSGLHWDVLGLYGQVLDGLAAAGRAGAVDSIGVDTWAVDYGLLDRTGALLGDPYCYRDSRTDGVADRVHAERSHAELFAENGLQLLPFNTIYQLAAAAGTPQLDAAERLLLVPDLVGHWLTGAEVAEVTNASTTGLLDVRTHRVVHLAGGPWWACDRGCSRRWCSPGERIGTLLPAVASETGLDAGTPVTAVGSHDTASAVVAVPMDSAAAAYVSLGTWGLVGVELDRPVLSEDGRRAGFTNELGVDGRTRFLKNVMGLWLLSECIRRGGPPAGPPTSRPCSVQQRSCRPAARSSTSRTRGSCRRATCPPASPRPSRSAATGRRATRSPSSGASSTASPPRSPRPCTTRPGCRASGAGGARRRRWVAQHPAVPAHGRRPRPARPGRTGRGDRARQRPRPGPGLRCGQRDARGAARARPRRARPSPPRAAPAADGLDEGGRLAVPPERSPAWLCR
jgi:hypothetical protein